LTELIFELSEYSFVIPHDVKTLVGLMGGEKAFESRLDLMVRTSVSENAWHDMTNKCV
jgi:putative alpha-1,2-mannosidase